MMKIKPQKVIFQNNLEKKEAEVDERVLNILIVEVGSKLLGYLFPNHLC